MRRLSTLCLATWLAAGLPQALAGHPSPIPTPATLKSITVTDVPKGQEVLLRVDGKYTFRASDAAQGVLYVDLIDTNMGSVPALGALGEGPLAGYQLREFKQPSGEPTVRVEVQTRSPQSFITRQGDSGLRLLFDPPTTGSTLPSASAKQPTASPANSAEGPVLVTNIVARTGPSGEVAIDVATTKSATFHRQRLGEPDRFVIDLDGTKNRCPESDRSFFPLGKGCPGSSVQGRRLRSRTCRSRSVGGSRMRRAPHRRRIAPGNKAAAGAGCKAGRRAKCKSREGQT